MKIFPIELYKNMFITSKPVDILTIIKYNLMLFIFDA